jgi:hypothetical protein
MHISCSEQDADALIHVRTEQLNQFLVLMFHVG